MIKHSLGARPRVSPETTNGEILRMHNRVTFPPKTGTKELKWSNDVPLTMPATSLTQSDWEEGSEPSSRWLSSR